MGGGPRAAPFQDVIHQHEEHVIIRIVNILPAGTHGAGNRTIIVPPTLGSPDGVYLTKNPNFHDIKDNGEKYGRAPNEPIRKKWS